MTDETPVALVAGRRTARLEAGALVLVNGRRTTRIPLARVAAVAEAGTRVLEVTLEDGTCHAVRGPAGGPVEVFARELRERVSRAGAATDSTPPVSTDSRPAGVWSPTLGLAVAHLLLMLTLGVLSGAPVVFVAVAPFTLGILGVGFLLMFEETLHEYRARRRWPVATASVVADHPERIGRKGGRPPRQFRAVTFTTPGGREARAVIALPEGKRLERGALLDIRYNPAAPEEAAFDSRAELIATAIITAVFVGGGYAVMLAVGSAS